MTKVENILYFACNIILILSGIILIFMKVETVGGSLVAGGIAGIVVYWATYLTRKNTQEEQELLNTLHQFSIVGILPRRLTKEEGDEFSGKAVNSVDILGFGLGRFREDVSDGHLERIAKRVKVRILAVHPDSLYCDQRDYEENRQVGSIKEDVMALTKFIKNLNDPNVKLRWYKAIPTTHVLRADNEMLVGAYIIGLPSRTTYTVKLEPGMLFDYYLNHYSKIWDDPKLSCEPEYDRFEIK